MSKECQKCHHRCHCDKDLHSDVYGLCACENCNCVEVKSKEPEGLVISDDDECLSCQ